MRMLAAVLAGAAVVVAVLVLVIFVFIRGLRRLVRTVWPHS
jgi:hypothetical protein